MRQVVRHIEVAPASPELTAAAHSLVATLRRAHSGKGGYDAAWPVHATAATGAAASSPRRQHGGTPPCRGVWGVITTNVCRCIPVALRHTKKPRIAVPGSAHMEDMSTNQFYAGAPDSCRC